MKHIKASNWVAEVATPTSTGFRLLGSSQGYATFKSAFGSSQDVFYSAHDEDGNREAGYATFNGSAVVNRHPTATLVNGIYSGVAPSMVRFNGDVTLACTFNASAFNLMFESLQALDPDGDGTISIPPELINGLGDSLRSKADKVDLDKEIQDRKDGDKALQDQIDNIDVSGGDADWGSITGKPSTFPPSAHNHDGDYLKAETDPTVPAHVKGITEQNIADWNAGGGGSSYDDTQIKADLATETQARIDGDAALDLRIDAVEGSISGGGGFVEAPNDGKLYGRQSESWAEVPDGGVSDWADIENKPTEFPPADHDQPWSTITDTPDDYPPEDHTHEIDDIDGLQDALDNAGESYAVAIADTPPENGKSGDTWFDSTEGEGALYIHDGDVWFSSNTFSQGSSGGSGGSVEAIASGALATGETVVVNADGTVSIAKETVTSGGDMAAELGGKVEFYDPRAGHIASAYDANSGKIVVSYRQDSSDFGIAIAGEILGDTIVFDTPVVYHSSSCRDPGVCFDQSSGKVVIAFQDQADRKGKAVAGQVSGNTILFGSPVEFESTGSTWHSATYDPSVEKVVIAYRLDKSGKAVVGFIDGGTLSFGQPSIFQATGECSYLQIAYDPISESTIIAYQDDDNGRAGTAVVGKIAGNSSTLMTFGTPVVFDAEETTYRSVAYDHASKKMVIAYISTDSNKGRLVVSTVSGDTINFGTPVDFADIVNSSHLTVRGDPVLGKVVIVYGAGSTSKGAVIAGEVSGDSAAFEATSQFDSNNTMYPSICFDPISKKWGIFYTDSTNNKGYGRVYSSGGKLPDIVGTNLTDTNYIGTSSADYADGEAATIQTVGSVSEDQSGLTAGLAYYVQPDGSLGTSGDVFAGTAISPTKLIVKG